MISGRREFLKNAGRVLAIGALGALCFKLIRRRTVPGSFDRTRPTRETCINKSICRGCPVFTDCGLPQALSARRAGVRS